jgi:hypothetical protein
LAIDRVNGFNFSIAVTLRGVISHADWISAFAKAQKRHPLLNACIGYQNRDGVNDPHAPVFVRTANRPIPLNFRRRTSSTEWQRVMEAEQAKSFDASTAPFLRATLLEDSEGCDLILTANHVVLDGVGTVVLLRDLLAALSGEPLLPLPLALSAEERTTHARSTTSELAKASHADGTWPRTDVHSPHRDHRACDRCSPLLSGTDCPNALLFAPATNHRWLSADCRGSFYLAIILAVPEKCRHTHECAD